MKKIIFWILVLLWMTVIFSFSRQNGVESGNLSTSFSKIIVDFLLNKNKIDINTYHSILSNVSFIIRKMAHFSEYLILSVLLNIAINTSFNYSLKKCFFISLVLSLVYALTDEFHQFFINGRNSSVIDVLIDFSGSIFGCLIYAFYDKVLRRN